MFFVYKNRFLAWQMGMVMAFIPDNISAHVHLLEDNYPIKITKMAAVSWGFFRLADFPQKQQEGFSEDHDRFISVDSVGREKSIYTTSNFFQVVVLILEVAITFFSVQVATITVCMQWPPRVFVNHSKDAFV